MTAMLTRRQLLGTAVAAGATTLGLGLYGRLWESHWLEFTFLDLPVRGLPADLIGARLVQLSDIHVGPRVDDAYIAHAFAQVTALAPDIVAYTGDFVSIEDGGGDVYAHAERMYAGAPRGRLATVGITGNHEYGRHWAHPAIADRLSGIFAASGIRMLHNQLVDVAGLQIVGLDDLWGAQFDATAALARFDPGRAGLALSHNPDTVDLPVWRNFRGWILAGHTHGGQVRPPFLPPPIMPVKNRRYTAGAFALTDERTLYVSRGVGHFFQLRINVRPEVPVFTLQRA